MSEDLFFTGIQKLDAATGGFLPGELILLAGEAAMGRTSFALSMMLSNVQTKQIGYISLQESLFRFKQRTDLVSDMFENLTFEIASDGLTATLETTVPIKGSRSHFFVHRVFPSVTELCELTSQLFTERQVDCIIINCMTFVGPRSSRLFEKKRRYENLLRHLKVLARLISIPIILIAGIDIKKRSKRGFYSYFACREPLADRIITLHRWEYYNRKKDDFGQKVSKGDTTVCIAKSVYPIKDNWMTLCFDHDTRLFLDSHELESI
jgi:replicative DNA helicase